MAANRKFQYNSNRQNNCIKLFYKTAGSICTWDLVNDPNRLKNLNIFEQEGL